MVDAMDEKPRRARGHPSRAFESHNLKGRPRCRLAAGAVEPSPIGLLKVAGHTRAISIGAHKPGRETGSPDVHLKKQVEQAPRAIEPFLLRRAGGRNGGFLARLAPF